VNSDHRRCIELQTRSPEEMQTLAQEMVGVLGAGTVLGLVGPLGAGKTTFVQGAALGLHAKDSFRVKSPTYALWHTYPTQPVLHHIDLYRLGEVEEVYAMGIDEAFEDEDAIVCVEWADLAPALLGPHAVWLSFPPNADPARKLVIQLPERMTEIEIEALEHALTAYKC
jgi:tRNA threonylcarbamoyladenosine biosynthesis protein TsaE